MADELSVTIEPAGAELDLVPGETQTLLAKATLAGATFAWTRNAGEPTPGPSIQVSGSESGIGQYEVTATVATGATTRTAKAAVHVKLAPEEKPALWFPDFARWSAAVIAGLVVVLSLPAYVIAWRAAFGKDTGTQVVAMFLVLPGLLALGAGIFVLLLDYRGRMLKPSQLGPAGRAITADGAAKVLQALALALNTMSKATRGATVLVVAAVAIFGFAAWAAVGGDGPAKPSDDPTTPAPSTSTTPTEGTSTSPSPGQPTSSGGN
ncbi:hypothetical protein [Nocardioides sp. WS12]|uniref:hypothetical protein n=1 Tax=Nocardioides sp. WS12 TaxID=2486272 RepID=UPI0015F7CDB0|nr:hypothetical protein [Nocardioides sp. WS12]